MPHTPFKRCFDVETCTGTSSPSYMTLVTRESSPFSVTTCVARSSRSASVPAFAEAVANSCPSLAVANSSLLSISVSTFSLV
eukprot:15118_5